MKDPGPYKIAGYVTAAALRSRHNDKPPSVPVLGIYGSEDQPRLDSDRRACFAVPPSPYGCYGNRTQLIVLANAPHPCYLRDAAAARQFTNLVVAFAGGAQRRRDRGAQHAWLPRPRSRRWSRRVAARQRVGFRGRPSRRCDVPSTSRDLEDQPPSLSIPMAKTASRWRPCTCAPQNMAQHARDDDAGAHAALLADPALPPDRDAEEHREDEEGQKEYEPDDPPPERKRCAFVPTPGCRCKSTVVVWKSTTSDCGARCHRADARRRIDGVETHAIRQTQSAERGTYMRRWRGASSSSTQAQTMPAKCRRRSCRKCPRRRSNRTRS